MSVFCGGGDTPWLLTVKCLLDVQSVSFANGVCHSLRFECSLLMCHAYKHAQPTQAYETPQVYISLVRNASICIILSKGWQACSFLFAEMPFPWKGFKYFSSHCSEWPGKKKAVTVSCGVKPKCKSYGPFEINKEIYCRKSKPLSWHCLFCE